MIVDSAYISGLIPFLTSLYIFVDSVSIPGPFVKWVITKSSSDIVNASRNPEKIPGMISGRNILLSDTRSDRFGRKNSGCRGEKYFKRIKAGWAS